MKNISPEREAVMRIMVLVFMILFIASAIRGCGEGRKIREAAERVASGRNWYGIPWN